MVMNSGNASRADGRTSDIMDVTAAAIAGGYREHMISDTFINYLFNLLLQLYVFIAQLVVLF